MAPRSDGWLVPHLMRSEVVADRLDVDVETINRLRRAGALNGVLIGRSYRYHPEDVLALIESRRGTGAGEGTPHG